MGVSLGRWSKLFPKLFITQKFQHKYFRREAGRDEVSGNRVNGSCFSTGGFFPECGAVPLQMAISVRRVGAAKDPGGRWPLHSPFDYTVVVKSWEKGCVYSGRPGSSSVSLFVSALRMREGVCWRIFPDGVVLLTCWIMNVRNVENRLALATTFKHQQGGSIFI